ncbi:hypothetical protein [uncultured Pseudoteredinibacter sp.]|uniref:hypothetical protein n=1 Tax=uncultured Pseudoteredinibacter sp. TaxID=1641701 RepID=UPI00261642D7|nr:hypothetical protein [uncultured Pseudoteredinibacter sp.]
MKNLLKSIVSERGRSSLLILSATLLSACSTNAQPADEKERGPVPESTQGVEDNSASDFSKIQRALDQINGNSKLAVSYASSKTTSIDRQLAGESSTALQENPSMQSSKKINMGNGMGMNMGKSMGMGKGMKMDMSAPMSMQGMQKDKMMMGKCKGMMCKMGMKNMSMMGQPPKDQAPGTTNTETSLPGYVNVPHLYHIGESEFFLDHSAHLDLTQNQIDQLKAIQSQWQSQQNTIISERDSHEQRLWEFTAMGQPDYKAIQETVMAIESINSKLRLIFIKQVGQAVTVLTAQQVSKLTDTKL